MMKILHEDLNLIVVVKPANMPIQKDFSRTPDLLSNLEEYLGSKPYLIHRLDRHVSGPVVFAKTKAEAGRLNKELTGSGFKKIYYAVVVSSLDYKTDNPAYDQLEEGIHANHYYRKNKGVSEVIDDEGYKKLSGGDQKLFKKGTMIVRRLQAIETDGVLVQKLEIDLRTGRFHQIRSGLSFMGLPIAGDPKYGVTGIGGQSFSTIGLQCVRLGFHEKGHKAMTVFESVHHDGAFGYFKS